MKTYIRLIAITDPALHPKIPLPDACRAAVQGGATAIQVRLKAEGAGELLRVTETIARAVDVPVFVNDRADVAVAAGAAGVHFGADDFPPAITNMLPLPKLRIGFSVGSKPEALAALAARADYWSIGPCFVTRSKNDAGTPLSKDQITALMAIATPETGIVGIGGIDVNGIEVLKSLGVQGVAVIRAVFGATNIEKATRILRDALDAP